VTCVFVLALAAGGVGTSLEYRDCTPACRGGPRDAFITVVGMLDISGGDPSFRNDDGSAYLGVNAALADFAAGRGTEYAVMTALAASRLLVPVVAVLADQIEPARPRSAEPAAVRSAIQGEKASEMAMPTLIGVDGRRAVPAFTSLESMSRWQSDARPVPVTALAVWQSACADSSAVVIDVAGPVPFAVEGARLAALARGEAPPRPFADPDVQETVAAVLAGQLDVASFELQPDDGRHDLAIVLVLTPGADGERDVAQLGAEVADAVMARLGGRLRRGVAIWLGDHPDAS
jgi:SseB protein N-terminal domain